jgi:D-alanyl-D-alanine endopeptidase (penicillin-binding protein 7)
VKRIVVGLCTVFGLSLAAGPATAEADASEKPAAVKKHLKAHRHKRADNGSADHDTQHLSLKSSSALVQDQESGAVLYEKNAGAVLPIASITKLMTAMVSLDAQPDMAEVLIIGDEDVDILKGTHSRLKVGTRLTREQMLQLALMSSENRAAAALSRHYAGGREAFVTAMNQKAQTLGLTDTRFYDPTGLTATNVSSARDLAKMVAAAHEYPLIREFTTTASRQVAIGGRPQVFRNTNALVRNANSSWDIGLSKTGYINEAGRCLVMQAQVNHKSTIIVLLDS